MGSLVAAHRPELADLVASADLDLDFPGLWLRPHDSAAWLAGKLFAVAVESGLPLEWIRVLPEAEPGREAELVAGGFCRRCYDRCGPHARIRV
jgi:hypothetical protein